MGFLTLARPNRLSRMYKINAPMMRLIQVIHTHEVQKSYFMHLFILNCMHGYSAAFYSYSVCSEFTDIQVLSYYYSA